MELYGWDNCPEPTRRQVSDLLNGLQKRMGSAQAGVYLHGSLAMGCFNPSNSDIDLLAVVERATSPETKKVLIEFLLALSGSPHPLEISFLRPQDMYPWRYPVPFDLHCSEEWRARNGEDLATGAWKEWGKAHSTDPDLAAHITVIRARGIRLSGESIERTFPDVPRRDYLASIVSDLEYAGGKATPDAVYGVLNACRSLAYLQDGYVYSKEEGAVWAMKTLPAEFQPAIKTAFAAYGGLPAGAGAIEPEIATRLLEHAIAMAQAAYQAA